MNTDNITEKAGKVAGAIANEFNLDFTVESLKTVDTMLHGAKRWKRESKDLLVEGLGSYVGEVLIRETDGRWCIDEKYQEPMGTDLVLKLPGNITASPFGRCRKRIEHGESDGVEVWARVVVATSQQREDAHV